MLFEQAAHMVPQSLATCLLKSCGPFSTQMGATRDRMGVLNAHFHNSAIPSYGLQLTTRFQQP